MGDKGESLTPQEQALLATFADEAAHKQYVVYGLLGGAAIQPELLEGYDQWRSTMSAGTRMLVETKAHLIDNFAYFEEGVRNCLRSGMQFNQLGIGRMATVSAIQVDGVEYAVRKINRPKDMRPILVDEYANNLIPVIGIPYPRIEQLQAISYNFDGEGVTVSQRVSGRRTGKHWTAENLARVTDFQLSELLHMIAALYDHKRIPDVAPDNTLFDPEEGFGLVDVIPPWSSQNLGHIMGVVCANMCSELPHHGVVETNELELRQQVLARAQAVCKREFEGVRHVDNSLVVDGFLEKVRPAEEKLREHMRRQDTPGLFRPYLERFSEEL